MLFIETSPMDASDENSAGIGKSEFFESILYPLCTMSRNVSSALDPFTFRYPETKRELEIGRAHV